MPQSLRWGLFTQSSNRLVMREMEMIILAEAITRRAFVRRGCLFGGALCVESEMAVKMAGGWLDGVLMRCSQL